MDLDHFQSWIDGLPLVLLRVLPRLFVPPRPAIDGQAVSLAVESPLPGRWTLVEVVAVVAEVVDKT